MGLTITRRILEQQPELQLFSLRADAARRRLVVALDKVRNEYTTQCLDAMHSSQESRAAGMLPVKRVFD